MSTTPPVIVLFRNDLRVGDHPALVAAHETGAPLLPVFVLDNQAAGRWAPGGASRWWLHHALEVLAEALGQRGAHLILRRGDTIGILGEIASETGASAVYTSRAFEPWAAALERKLNAELSRRGIAVRRFAGTLLHDPDTLLTKSGGPYKVYSPFWRALSSGKMRAPLDAPDRLDGFDGSITSDRIADWQLLPTAPDWAGGIRAAWAPGERHAHARLARFLDEAASDYADRRDLPGIEATSRLSPYLHFGEISPAAVWQATEIARESGNVGAKGAGVFLKEVAWREFSYHLLHHFPSLPDTAFRADFEAFPWAQSAAHLSAWQRGATGYPIVDAGMRELWTTGWMHNRVRMITASFLTKHLLLPWQAGEAWFWDCLVDADLASNAASWQWVAGSGADAAPYFRIFNPILQGVKFDADGAYVRRWVPELAALPDKHLHAPWQAPPALLAAAGIELGRDYPLPIVDHTFARDRALAAYDRVRGG